MKRYSSYIRPGFPLIATPQRIEVDANSAEYAELLIRHKHPGWSYSKPREVEPERPPLDAFSTDWAILGEGPVRKAMEIEHV